MRGVVRASPANVVGCLGQETGVHLIALLGNDTQPSPSLHIDRVEVTGVFDEPQFESKCLPRLATGSCRRLEIQIMAMLRSR